MHAPMLVCAALCCLSKDMNTLSKQDEEGMRRITDQVKQTWFRVACGRTTAEAGGAQDARAQSMGNCQQIKQDNSVLPKQQPHKRTPSAKRATDSPTNCTHEEASNMGCERVWPGCFMSNTRGDACD